MGFGVVARPFGRPRRRDLLFDFGHEGVSPSPHQLGKRDHGDHGRKGQQTDIPRRKWHRSGTVPRIERTLRSASAQHSFRTIVAASDARSISGFGPAAPRCCGRSPNRATGPTEGLPCQVRWCQPSASSGRRAPLNHHTRDSSALARMFAGEPVPLLPLSSLLTTYHHLFTRAARPDPGLFDNIRAGVAGDDRSP